LKTKGKFAERAEEDLSAASFHCSQHVDSISFLVLIKKLILNQTQEIEGYYKKKKALSPRPFKLNNGHSILIIHTHNNSINFALPTVAIIM
jgi:hypothetical protein